MIIKAIYKIGNNYVVGDNRKIYRLPHTSNRKHYNLRELKPYKNGYYIDGVYTKKEDIKYESIEPYILIEVKETPFD